jgi:glutamine synthetase
MFLSCSTIDDVLKAIKTKNVEMIDLRFTDLPGTWQHFSRRPQNPTGSKTTIDYSARD